MVVDATSWEKSVVNALAWRLRFPEWLNAQQFASAFNYWLSFCNITLMCFKEIFDVDQNDMGEQEMVIKAYM